MLWGHKPDKTLDLHIGLLLQQVVWIFALFLDTVYQGSNCLLVLYVQYITSRTHCYDGQSNFHVTIVHAYVHIF